MKEISVWTAYFDASRSRRYGRRVRADLAVRKPTQEEVVQAAKRLGLSANPEDAYYPKDFWEKGRIKISWAGKKQALLNTLARELRNMRQEHLGVNAREKS
ncbi:MAG: signal recognition particle subunit SRP19/SEC65 family protein [Thermoprotei archaeon]